MGAGHSMPTSAEQLVPSGGGAVGGHDLHALFCLAVLPSTYWVRRLFYESPIAAAEAEAATDGVGVAGGAGAGVAAAAGRTDAGVAAMQLLLLASLLAAAFASRTWRKWRCWAVAALRLASFAPVLHAATIQHNLAREPSSLLADTLALLFGCRAVRLCFLSIALPLDLLPHLLVQTACLASTFQPAYTRRACSLSLLDNAVMEQRFKTFHALMGLGSLGLLPPDYPAGDRLRQCAAALDCITLWVGWLLLTYLAARGQHRRTVMLASGQQRGSRGNTSSTSSHATGRHSPSSATQGAEWAPGAAHLGIAAAPAGPSTGLQQQHPGQGCWGKLSTALARWMLENMFLWDGLPCQDWLAWFVWTALCWLGGTVIALASF